VRSLKRPEEVQYLRELYGPRFILVSVFSSREDRIASLQRQGMSEAEAIQLVVRDEGDDTEHGQATRDAFQLADLFLEGNWNQARAEVQRFIDLILGSPLYTPHRDEHGMFLAYATSLRSGDLSRQVGAILTTADGVLLSEGCNDAPRFDGGSHWPGPADRRDLSLGYDSNERAKQQMLNTIVSAGIDCDQRRRIQTAVESSGLLDITEYGRAVHAEMAALMACTRQGTSTRGAKLYCTTFPCHNCAKHIVAAGVHEVLFVEPYPKSRALSLHDDALSMSPCEGKVHMRHFVGVGPRRYQHLFALQGPYGERVKRKEGWDVRKWDRRRASPAFHDRLVTYLQLEEQAVAEFGRFIDVADAKYGAMARS
jgi:deoxycytidylate deaminase